MKIKRVLLENNRVMVTSKMYDIYMEKISNPDIKIQKLTEDYFGEGDIWEDDFIEELSSEELKEDATVKQSREQKMSPGNIIMVTNFYSPSFGGMVKFSPHRVLVTAGEEIREDGIKQYYGFLLSSKYNKSNKFKPKYSDNIYINNYGTILEKGSKVDKEVFINVSDLVSFTDEDISKSGYWKGKVSSEFAEFIETVVSNVGTGKNKDLFWIK